VHLEFVIGDHQVEPPVSIVIAEGGTHPGARFGVGGEVKTDVSKLRSVDVILRSSEEAGRATVDLMQIWKGELRFVNVPVVLPKPPEGPAK